MLFPIALACVFAQVDRASASTRGFFAYVQIQGYRAGYAGSVSASAMTMQTIARPSYPTVANAPAPSASPRNLNPNSVTLTKPSASPPHAFSIACSTILLSFQPNGQYSVQGSYEPNSSVGCLFVIPLSANAPETGSLSWRVREPSGLGGQAGGKVKFSPLRTPNPPVTLQPGQTRRVRIDYDPNTNGFELWPV